MSDSENTKEAVTCLENQSNFRASDVRIEENHDLIANLSLDSNLFEDRIRVDRRKLEQLMLESGEKRQNAEEFFNRIMKDTNTTIAWPSKLKIGAKSKKDPIIIVTGSENDVIDAKNKIMMMLDTKSLRVTLKVEVSHTEHSHVIGKGGHNIKRVMQETDCHIHFPDSNRCLQGEKNNQVSITGPWSSVESARLKIRDLLPLVYILEFPVISRSSANLDSSSLAVQQIQQKYGVVVIFKQNFNRKTAIIRGSVYNVKPVKDAVTAMHHLLTGKNEDFFSVSLLVNILPKHHFFIIGQNGDNIKEIMQQTGAVVHFPDPSTPDLQTRCTVYITGTLEKVFLARQMLLGCLPVVLMFDISDEADISSAHLNKIVEQMDVFVRLKPKAKQPVKSVVMKTVEQNISNLYKARHCILGLVNEAIKTVQPIMTATNPQFASPGNPALLEARLSAPVIPGVFNATTPFNVIKEEINMQLNNKSSMGDSSKTTALQSELKATLPTHQWPNYLQMMTKDTNMNSLSSSVQPTNHSAVSLFSDELFNYLNLTNSSNTLKGYSSDFQILPSKPTDMSESMLNDAQRPWNNFNSKISFGQLGSPARDVPPKHSLGYLGSSDSLSDFPLGQLGSLACGADNSFGLKCSSDVTSDVMFDQSKAPGNQRPDLKINSSFFKSDDKYEQMRLNANRAISKRPMGEPRVPTDLWSGFGFSNSVPDYLLQSKLSQFGLGSRLPNITSLAENFPVENEVDDTQWNDGLLSCNNLAPKINILDESSILGLTSPSFNTYQMPNVQNTELGGVNSISPSCQSKATEGGDWLRSSELAELLSKLGLGKYTDLFNQQEIDFETFLTLNSQDLKELGVSTFGARRRMILAIADLKNKKPAENHHQVAPPPGFSNLFKGQVPSQHHDFASQSGHW